VRGERRGLRVGPSPLNPVKLELGLLLVGGLLLLLLHPRLVEGAGGQILLLVGYGLAAAAWLVWRARRVLAAARRGREGRA